MAGMNEKSSDQMKWRGRFLIGSAVCAALGMGLAIELLESVGEPYSSPKIAVGVGGGFGFALGVVFGRIWNFLRE
jgi:hypothetical protein